jgi:hypothetical protein
MQLPCKHLRPLLPQAGWLQPPRDTAAHMKWQSPRAQPGAASAVGTASPSMPAGQDSKQQCAELHSSATWALQ